MNNWLQLLRNFLDGALKLLGRRREQQQDSTTVAVQKILDQDVVERMDRAVTKKGVRSKKNPQQRQNIRGGYSQRR